MCTTYTSGDSYILYFLYYIVYFYMYLYIFTILIISIIFALYICIILQACRDGMTTAYNLGAELGH